MAITACGTSAGAPAAGGGPPPPEVAVEVAALREIHPADDLSGRVEAIHHVEIHARVSGYVTAVRYHEGSEVAAGTVLFSIDARPYLATLARANADLARAKARLELTVTEAGRGEKLLAANAIPKSERDILASTTAQAEAEVQSARATVSLAQLDVEFTSVRAPMAGRTGRAAVTVGDYVQAGASPASMTTVVSLDPIYVYFTGDEQTYLRYASHSETSKVTVGLADETGYPHLGQVDFVDNSVDAKTGTILVRAIVPNADKRLVPGLFARVRIPEGDAVNAVLIDDKAVLTDQDRKYVYVLGAGETVERRDVKLGRIVDGLRLVNEGVKPGDRVITTNIQKVYPGSKATVAKTLIKAAVLP